VVPREKAPALEVTGTVAVVGALPHTEVELRALEAFSTRVIMPDTVIVDVSKVCGGAGWFVLFWKWRGLSLSVSWSKQPPYIPWTRLRSLKVGPSPSEEHTKAAPIEPQMKHVPGVPNYPGTILHCVHKKDAHPIEQSPKPGETEMCTASKATSFDETHCSRTFD
jgi:hypothetical protein